MSKRGLIGTGSEVSSVISATVGKHRDARDPRESQRALISGADRGGGSSPPAVHEALRLRLPHVTLRSARGEMLRKRRRRKSDD